MTHDIFTSAFVACTAAVTYVGSQLLAVSSAGWIPDNVEKIGVVALLLICVVWFARKMEAAEKREHKMQEAHMQLLQQMAEAQVKTSEALERNSKILERVEAHLSRRSQ